MAYLYNTPSQQAEMLAAIGVNSIDELLDQVPSPLRFTGELNLPPALTELELEQHVRSRADRNVTGRKCFLGGGAYDHYIPAVVDEIAGRGEFYTAYTPYQPEASQGSLQAFFEFQSLICRLSGMDVSNASLYEGGTAASEAVFMAMRSTGRHQKVLVSEGVNPEYLQVIKTYTDGLETEVVTIPLKDGRTDLARAAELADDATACILFQHPNYLGCLEEPEKLCDLAHRNGAMSVASFDPISCGLLKRPGDYGADIAVAEGQPLGIPLQYGGPYLGILACRNDFVRKMPGRLIARTTDRDGKQCYVLGLQTREQHIRRDKATSNICTNQGLLALRATVYLSLVGPQGLREAAQLCCEKAHYAAEQLAKVPGLKLAYAAPFFKEFTVEVKQGSAADMIEKAARGGFDIGPALDRLPGQKSRAHQFLVAVTESRTKAEIDALAKCLGG